MAAFSLGCFWALASLMVWCFPFLANASLPSITLTCDGPGTLDVPIRFSAHLMHPGTSGPFVFRWEDDASPAHWKEVSTHRLLDNQTFEYASHVYRPQELKMTVMAFAMEGPFSEALAQAQLKFQVKSELSGQIRFNGSMAPPSGLVASDYAHTLSVRVHDPGAFFRPNLTTYFWFINDTFYGEMRDNFTFQFPPGQTFIEAMFMATHVDEPPPNISTHVNTSTKGLRHSLQRLQSPVVKHGVSRQAIIARRSLTGLNVSGPTWFRHGELLNLILECDGSGPWEYCWSIKNSGYNVTGNETCVDPQTLSVHCQFPAVWYFRQSGTYDILFILSNGVSRIRRLVHVNVYDVHKQMPISFVVVPIISILAASVACVAGIFAFVTLRRNLSVEIADFDFSQTLAEDLEYKTFWERLKDSLIYSFSNTSEVFSSISGVSSRSVSSGGSVGAVGIHYGSMT